MEIRLSVFENIKTGKTGIFELINNEEKWKNPSVTESLMLICGSPVTHVKRWDHGFHGQGSSAEMSHL